MSQLPGSCHVFLSPHPDDIALSLGSICAERYGAGRRTLVTVFSRTDFIGPSEPRDEDWSSYVRAVEDVTFAKAFGMDRIDLGLADFPLRTGRPVQTCCEAPVDATDIVYEALAELEWPQDATIFAPAAHGSHVDHVACRDAALRLGREKGITVLLYADMPYSVRAPGRIGPHYTLVAGDPMTWWRAVRCYPTQARLAEETVGLVGQDGPPLAGAYLAPVVEAAGSGQMSVEPADSPSASPELLHRLGALEQALARSDQRAQAAQQRLEFVAAVAASQHAAVLELRDSLHYAARQSTLQRRRTRVLFLVHLIEAWDGCHDVVRAMEVAEDFEPIVASIPRHFAGIGALEFEDEVHRGLERAGVSHIRLAPPDMAGALRLVKSLEPDLIFRQSQWDLDVADVFGPDRLNFARTCLIPYETMNIVQNAPLEGTSNSAVDLPYHRGAWVVFCANDLVLDMARRDGARGGANFRVVGHPKADRVRSAQPAWPVRRGDAAAAPRRIAWSAHHTVGTGWTDFGAFPLMAEDMLAWALERPDAEFVFLPHPMLVPTTRTPASPITAVQFDAWLSEWEALPNTEVSVAGNYAPVLAASDLLITDGLSMLLEYQLLEKPLLFFERPGHRPFNEIGELVRGGVHTVTTVASARETAQRLLDEGQDPLAPVQRDVTHRLFGDRPSAERILDTLREMIAAERGEERPAAARPLPTPARVRRAA